jgi:hypothetical protein
MRKVEAYRAHARRCELLLEKVTDPRIRQQLRRERQEWLELAASREAMLRNERWSGERPLDEDMTLSSLRAFEAARGPRRSRKPEKGRPRKEDPPEAKEPPEVQDRRTL